MESLCSQAEFIQRSVHRHRLTFPTSVWLKWYEEPLREAPLFSKMRIRAQSTSTSAEKGLRQMAKAKLAVSQSKRALPGYRP